MQDLIAAVFHLLIRPSSDILLCPLPKLTSSTMPLPSSHLEYTEEDLEDPSQTPDDLFGPDPDQPSLRPGPAEASSSTSRLTPRPITSASLGLVSRSIAQERLEYLREKVRSKPEIHYGRGPLSLKGCCMNGELVCGVPDIA
jgi:hypothetical protein